MGAVKASFTVKFLSLVASQSTWEFETKLFLAGNTLHLYSSLYCFVFLEDGKTLNGDLSSSVPLVGDS